MLPVPVWSEYQLVRMAHLFELPPARVDETLTLSRLATVLLSLPEATDSE